MEIQELKKLIIEKTESKKFEEIYNQIQLSLINNKINEEAFYELINLFFIKPHVYQEKTEELLNYYIQHRFKIVQMSNEEILYSLDKAESSIEFMLMIFLLIKPKILCDNNDEIINHNKQVHQNLDKLIEFCSQTNTFQFDSVEKFKNVLLLNYTYYHVYNGLNNKDLFIKIAKLWKNLCPKLIYTADLTRSVNNTNNTNGKIKIGFASSFLQLNQSVCRDRIGIIRSLILDPGFDVYLFTTTKTEDEIYNVAINSVGFKNKVILEGSIENARSQIEKYNLDILVYPEIGMDLFFYLLAFSRLAPVQINTWGHSETSGIDTIDYYFSSKYYEIEDAGKFYSEKLIKMDSLCTYYFSIKIFDFYNEVTQISKDEARVKFNLPKIGIIYGMFQTVFKYHPDTLAIVKNILFEDPKAIIIMLTYPELEERFIDYLDRNFGYHSNRIRVFSRNSLREYCKLIKSCDVIIDSYPFGGCNSSLEAFSLGKPVFTLPSDKINGRFTYGFYQKMGIEEPICSNLNDLVSKSIFFANNKIPLEKLENKIKVNAEKLFEEDKSIETWKNKLIELNANIKNKNNLCLESNGKKLIISI